MTNIPHSAFGIPSEEIWKSYIIIPKFGAVVSMAASAFLARDIIIKWREKHHAVPLTNIILFGISVIDIIGTFFGWFMTSWMVPEGDAPFAVGNRNTCNVQGFAVTFQFIYFVTAYTGLAVLYWLIVERSWKEDYMKQAKIRCSFLLPPVIVSLVFAIVPLFYEMYNVTIVFCYLKAYPPDCHLDPNVECTRGEKAMMLQTVQFLYTMACNVVIIIFMSLLVHSVYNRERQGDAYLTSGQMRNRSMTKKTAWQGVRYVLAFTVLYFAVYVFAFSNIALRTRGGTERGTAFVASFYVHVLLNPLMGLANALVYYRPRYISYKEHNPEKSRLDRICHILHISLPSCPTCSCWKHGPNHEKNQSTEPTVVSPLIQERASGECDNNLA